MTSARQQLGEVIKHARTTRALDLRDVSRRVGAKVADVEDWEAGRTTPEPIQWTRMKGAVSRRLSEYSDLYHRARHEQRTEPQRRSEPMQPNGHNGVKPHETKITTNVGAKLNQALAAPSKLEPASVDVQSSEPPKVRRPRPAGGQTVEQIEERRRFVRGLILQRPGIRTTGADSVLEAVRARFGVGISTPQVEVIREELMREQIRAEVAAEKPAPAPAPSAPASKPQPSEADLRAAIDLVLSAVPNLRRFTIEVDDRGEASVDYAVREMRVVETSGSIKVRR